MSWSRFIRLTDPLACQAAIQGAQVEILPTARGSFRVEITQIRLNRLWMQRFNVALPQISTVVIASDRKAIGFLTEPNSTGLQHCGIEVTRNDLLVHGSDLLHQRSEFGLSYGSMSVPMKDFLGLYETLTGREFLIDPCTTIVRPDPPLMSRLLRLHKTMEWLAHDTPEILDLAEVDRALEEQLIHLMVRCLASGKAVETTTGDRRHGAIMRKFEAFLEAYPNRPLYLTDICAGIGVAERTLRAACEEHLGDPLSCFAPHASRSSLVAGG
jgi:hypothetical protein